MRKLSLFFFAVLVVFSGFSQDVDYARKIISDLTSKQFHGRGYYMHGAKKSARYLSNEFEKAGLKPAGESYLQPFSISINCITGNPYLKVDGKNLDAGTEFLISRNAPATNGNFPVVVLNTEPIALDSLEILARTKNLSGSFVVTANNDRELMKTNILDAAGLIMLTQEDLWWHVSNGHTVMDIPVLKVRKAAMPANPEKVTIKIKNKFLKDYTTENVIGMVEGSKYPEKFVLITAHYDHLGRMGKKVFFPGAHDNASGTAMITDLARYFADNPPEISVLFIAFSAEETGLEGSYYYSENPVVPLENTLFSLNLDIIGSGSTGIKVVNGKVLPDYFNILKRINTQNNYVKKVGKRGEAANSDHYHLYRMGVPAFFIYTTGDEYTEYHTVNDKAEGLPLTAYDGLFRLVSDFILEFPLKP